VSKSWLTSLSAAIVLAAGSLIAQTPAFEVASIKPSEPVTPAMVAAGKLHVGMKIDAKRVDIGNFTLLQLMCKAYDVKPYQVSGPSWLMMLNGQRFDIVANLPEGATKEQVPQMLQALLADRFKLAIHRESKDQAIYAMVVGKGGLKIKETEEPAVAPDAPAPNPGVTGSSSVSVTQTKGGAVVSDGTGKTQKMIPSPDGKSMRLEISGATLAEMAEGLGPLVDHPVLDMTGLKGKYTMALDISMQDMMNAARAAGAAVPPSAPADAASDPGGSVFTSIQALGLKLEPRKSPMAMIVVDKVEKMPTEN
jgi:uncharacterized protein (TIGR03435 family)